MNDERKSKPSASGFARCVFCPGSRAAELAVPGTDEESEVAAAGTAIHSAIATGDFSNLGTTESEIAEHLDGMNLAALEQFKQDFITDAPTIVREERYWVKHRKTGEELASAKPDFAAYSDKCLLVVDCKTGFKAVTPAAGNWQLRLQLVALDQAFGPFMHARVAIAQHRIGEVFDACDYQRDDIEQAYAEVVFYLRRSEQPNVERVPGSHCFYCRARAMCREYECYAAMMPYIRTSPQLKPVKKADIVAKVELLSPEDLAFIESRRTSANNLFEAVTGRLKQLPAEQLALLGYELKSTGSNRSIEDPLKLWALLVENKLLANDDKGKAEFRSMLKVSFGVVDDLLVDRIRLRDDITAKEAAVKLKDLLIPITTFTEKEKSLKPLTPKPLTQNE